MALKPKWDASPLVPASRSLEVLRTAAVDCRACPLGEHATQTVFGEGISKARVVMIGEQPGDKEDRAGRPFVGPAGRLLDEALEVAGIDRSLVYITNVVKHFKFEMRGKSRIHKKPAAGEINACRPWLDAEMNAIKPQAVVCLGSTAAQALLGKDFRVTVSRGEFVESPLAPYVMATVHPASILRSPDPRSREEETRRFIADLKKVARHVTG